MSILSKISLNLISCPKIHYIMVLSGVKCSECLSDRASNILRRYTDHMKFAAYMGLFLLSHSFIFFWFHFLIVYMFVCFVYFYSVL